MLDEDTQELKNLAGIWFSNDNWQFKVIDDETSSIREILNIDNYKLLGISGNIADLKEQTQNQGSAGNLWQIGETDSLGYYLIIHNATNKVLTAANATTLTIEGTYLIKYFKQLSLNIIKVVCNFTFYIIDISLSIDFSDIISAKNVKVCSMQ